MNIRRILAALLIWVGLMAPGSPLWGTDLITEHIPGQFKDYWYPHGAEISRFALSQARYGEVHEGDAVLVYVTERMNPDIQIKADFPQSTDIPILKLNTTLKFYTGIYPYSILTSVFAPVEANRYPRPLKISSTTQEWCGHVYLQMNLHEKEYRVERHSYFESEGDQYFKVKSYLPEDAIWTTIRISPQKLPQGEFFLIPGAVFTRLRHRDVTPVQVIAKLEVATGKSLEGNSLVQYEVRFPDENRTLKIYFEKDFPHRVQGWEDALKTMIAGETKVLTTRATRTHTIMIDYWNHNHNTDRKLLKRLGLAEEK